MSNDTERSSYELLARLFGGNLDNLPESAKSEVSGYMALHFDLIGHHGDGTRIALAHYYRQNGDSVPDPDMELLVNKQLRTVQPLSFQDCFGHRTSYDMRDGTRIYREREYGAQSRFLARWLSNCIFQGHSLRPERRDDVRPCP
jgi:uncharacterized protein YqiB (DUF1249 family)